MSVSLVAQMIKNLPAMQETQVQSLSQEDQGMATHSNSLAWRIPWTDHRADMTEQMPPPAANDNTDFFLKKKKNYLSRYLFDHTRS